MTKITFSEKAWEDYSGMLETLYISSVPGLKEEIIAAANKPDSEFLTEDEVQW